MIIRDQKRQTVIVTYPKVKFNPSDITNHQKYCYFQLIKYSTWSNNAFESISNIETAIDRWNNFLLIAPSHILDCLEFDKELSDQLDSMRSESIEPYTDDITDQADWMYLASINPNVAEEEDTRPPVDTSYDWSLHRAKYSLSELEKMCCWLEKQKSLCGDISVDMPIVMPEQLNSIQRFAYEIVHSHMIMHKQLLMIIIGTAGTGKSFTTFALSRLLQPSVKRSAPTAKAAFIIFGETCHSLFQIRPNFAFVELQNKSLLNFQEKFKDISHIIIDEYSMISQDILAKIDMRCRQAKNEKFKYFGGLSVILVGDPGQLLPVSGLPLYSTRANNALNIQGYNVYQQFKVVVKLEQLVRQLNPTNCESQRKFIELLSRLRNGESTLADWEHLKTRFVSPSNINQFEDSLRIFPLNEQVNSTNAIKITMLNSPITHLLAHNSKSKGNSLDSDQFNGLEKNLYLCINAKVTLIHNLWTSRGLVNGATGIIRDIIYPLTRESDSLPEIIIVQVDSYRGPQFFQDKERKNWIPLSPSRIDSVYHDVTRTQYPLKLSYAMTTYKAQGQTINKCIMDIGKTERTLGLTFVCFTRYLYYPI